jgi:hypothetical protein
MNELPDDIAARFGLKKSGKSFIGPCPLCGGTDRFSVKRGKHHPSVMWCRQCGNEPFFQLFIEPKRGLTNDTNQDFTKDEIQYMWLFIKACEGAKRRGEQPTQTEWEQYRQYQKILQQPCVHSMAVRWGLEDE